MTHEKKVIFPDSFMMISDKEERKSWKTTMLLDFCVWNHIKFVFDGKKAKIIMDVYGVKYTYIVDYDDKMEKFRTKHWSEYDWDEGDKRDVYDEDFTLEALEVELAKKLS